MPAPGSLSVLRGVWKPVAAMLALGALSGFFVVDDLTPRGPPAALPPPGEGAMVDPPIPVVQPAAYSMFGSASSQDGGYQWAEMARIARIEQCPDAGPSFRQGCARYLDEAKANGAVVVHVGYAPRRRERIAEPAVEEVAEPVEDVSADEPEDAELSSVEAL